MNNKHEFGVNEIHGIQCSTSSRDQETQMKNELEKRQVDRAKTLNFIEVMSNIYTTNDWFNNCRSKRKTVGVDLSRNKRYKMNTSTPKQTWNYRVSEPIPDEASPILGDVEEGNNSRASPTTITTGTSAANTSQQRGTNLSTEMDTANITPSKILKESTEERKLAGGARDLSRTYKGSTSMPNLSWENIDNCLFSHYNSRREEHVVRKRRVSLELDMLNFHEWSNKDFSSEASTSKDSVGRDIENTKRELREETTGNESNKLAIVEQGGTVEREEVHAAGAESNKIAIVEQGSTVERDEVHAAGAESNNSMDTTGAESNNSVATEHITPDGSPALRTAKRTLVMSSSTPIGLQRKQQATEQDMKCEIITFEQNIEMTDLEEMYKDEQIDSLYKTQKEEAAAGN